MRTSRLLIGLAIACSGSLAAAQTGRGRGARSADAAPAAWFGVPMPPPLGKEPAVIVGSRAPLPFVMPPGEAASPELVGATIRKDLEAIVGFATESRTT